MSCQLSLLQKDEIEAGQKDREWPVAHMIRLPRLCLDEQIDGGSGFLCEKNIAKVCSLTDINVTLNSLSSHCRVWLSDYS